jgi:hypothetical protein
MNRVSGVMIIHLTGKPREIILPHWPDEPGSA